MARRWRRPGIFAIALTLVGVALFSWLGAWQIRRAHEKEALFAAFAGAATHAPIALDEARREAGAMRYPQVRLRGHYEPGHSYVLDNQVRDGHDGVMVFDVFEPDDGSAALLANRGFLARDAHGDPPAIPLPPSGEQVLIALYAPAPGTGLRLGGNPLPRQTTWPKTSIYLDLHEIEADLDRKLDPRVLLLMPGNENAARSAFVREWQPTVFPPARHYGYAFTWFMFALLAVGLFVLLHAGARKEDR